MLGNRHRQQTLAVPAELGALGDVAQPAEADVRTAYDRRQSLAGDAFAVDVTLQACHRERAGRLGDRPRVLEDILDRRADLVGGDEHDLVDAFARDLERLRPDLPHSHAIREDADALQHDALARRKRRVERRGVMRLDPDDPRLRPQRLDISRDAGDEPATSDLDEDRIEGLALLAHDFHAHGALPGDHVLVVERGNGDHPVLGREDGGPLPCPVERVAREQHFCLEPLHGLNLDAGCAVTGITITARMSSWRARPGRRPWA